jgi:hypothetical protein
VDSFGGLDLRDWFAGKALVGILMDPDTAKPGDTDFEVHTATVAEQAYAYAEAMLKERRKRQGEREKNQEPF